MSKDEVKQSFSCMNTYILLILVYWEQIVVHAATNTPELTHAFIHYYIVTIRKKSQESELDDIGKEESEGNQILPGGEGLVMNESESWMVEEEKGRL